MSNTRSVSEFINEFNNIARPPFRFNYPVQIFSDVQIPPNGLDPTTLRQRNSFLKYAEPTDVNVMLERAQVLLGVQDVIQQMLPGRKIKTVSLFGSYVCPWNEGKRNDIDANVFFEGEGFDHIPVQGIRQKFPNIPEGIEELEIVAIGQENAVYGTKTEDRFETTTGRVNVIRPTVAGLWNREIPIFGHDYEQIPNNEINLLRLARDLIESAIRRYQNFKLKKPEPEPIRMKKALCRIHEARIYLEELADGLGLGYSKLLLPVGSNGRFSPDSLYVGGILDKTIERYFQVERIIR